MARILKGIAIAAGTGMAIGLSATLGNRRELPRYAGSASGDVDQTDYDVLPLEPLLDRFDGIEARLEALEHRNDPSEPAGNEIRHASLADFDRRLGQQESAIRLLRADVEETNRRLAGQVEIAGIRFAQVREEIPLVVETTLNVRVNDLESSLRTELEASHRQSLETFEQAFDQKIFDRISSLEKTLAEQSASIGMLREGAKVADANLQRLIGAVERLCERTQAEPQPAPPSDPASFQGQLAQAMRNPVTSTPASSPAALDFRPRLVKEGESEEPKPRVPMARIIAALLAFGLTRFLH